LNAYFRRGRICHPNRERCPDNRQLRSSNAPPLLMTCRSARRSGEPIRAMEVRGRSRRRRVDDKIVTSIRGHKIRRSNLRRDVFGGFVNPTVGSAMCDSDNRSKPGVRFCARPTQPRCCRPIRQPAVRGDLSPIPGIFSRRDQDIGDPVRFPSQVQTTRPTKQNGGGLGGATRSVR